MTKAQNTAQDWPAEKVELLKKHISGWLRQSRYRGRRANIAVDVSYNEVITIYTEAQWKCAYCGDFPGSPDHPFPLKEKGPCVPANILPCCSRCRNKKQNHNLVKFYQNGHIAEDQLHSLIKQMICRKGGEILKEYLKSIYVDKESQIT